MTHVAVPAGQHHLHRRRASPAPPAFSAPPHPPEGVGSALRLIDAISADVAEHGFSPGHDAEVRKVIDRFVPEGCLFVLSPNDRSGTLHSQMAQLHGSTGDKKWAQRAANVGPRSATYPRSFSWDQLSTTQRKYVVYGFVNHSNEFPTLPLFPLTLARLIDYLEWLPVFGCGGSGWDSIRKYAEAVRAWSHALGWGDPVQQDERGYHLWQTNFSTNFEVSRTRASITAVRPEQVLAVGTQFDTASAEGAYWLLCCSLMWFTAIRPGHLLPETNRDPRHLPTSATEKQRVAADKNTRNLITFDNMAVQSTAEGLILAVRLEASKTMRSNHHRSETYGAACICSGGSRQPLCPVHAYLHYRDHFAPRGLPTPQYLASKGPEAFHRRAPFIAAMRSALRAAISAGVPTEVADLLVAQIAAKSLRAGSGTEAAGDANISDVQLSVHMGHKQVGTTRQFYIQLPVAKRAALISKRLAQGVTA